MSKIITDLSVLRQKSENVESVEEAKSIIESLKNIIKDCDHGIGLAAIQIGIPKRVAVIKWRDEFCYLINPKIVEGIEEFIFPQEGCLSIPGLFKDTKRYRQVVMKNQRIENDKFFEEDLFSDYYEDANKNLFVIALQHEMDHFDGKLIIDYDIKGQTIINDMPKVGRNEPCPCGSGKKYKKCCLKERS